VSAAVPDLSHHIEQSIRDAAGNSFRIDGGPIDLAPGGCAVLQGAGARYFCKLMDAAEADRLDAETDCLAAIAASRTFRTPAVVARGEAAHVAWLVLEWLDLRSIAEPSSARRAAETLAAMHAHEGPHFGWHRDNYIGATPQSNSPGDNWARFFALQRLQRQFELAVRNGYDKSLARDGERIVQRLPALFLDYRPRPSLLHGDLWHGNIACLPDGSPVLFDPACHYGDRESDLAMSELFGGFPGAFYTTYRQLAPLSEAYEARKLAYTLYHMLNHLNLFGRSYLSTCSRISAQLLRELSA